MKKQSKTLATSQIATLSAAEIEFVHGGGTERNYSAIEPYYERYSSRGVGGYVIYDFTLGMCYNQGSRPSVP
jgi:hypothetical protein